MGVTDRKLGARFAASLYAKSSTARLAETVVDDLFIQYRLLGETELASLRKAGGTNQELILATLIAFKTRQSATQLYLEVKSGSKSWGALLERAKINPAEIQKEIISLINRSR